MARKRRKQDEAPSREAGPPKPAAIGTAFGPLLERAGLGKLPPKAPPAPAKAKTATAPLNAAKHAGHRPAAHHSGGRLSPEHAHRAPRMRT